MRFLESTQALSPVFRSKKTSELWEQPIVTRLTNWGLGLLSLQPSLLSLPFFSLLGSLACSSTASWSYLSLQLDGKLPVHNCVLYVYFLLPYPTEPNSILCPGSTQEILHWEKANHFWPSLVFSTLQHNSVFELSSIWSELAVKKYFLLVLNTSLEIQVIVDLQVNLIHVQLIYFLRWL